MSEAATIKINEIFYSIQGESLLAGKPTVFIRTAACNLRCTWCDTGYSFWNGKVMALGEILAEVKKHTTKYVCVTGGEPLGQRNCIALLKLLVDEKYTVSLETNGSFSVKDVPPEVIKVIDIKCPDSGEAEANHWENIDLATQNDQFKFVVASRADFDWAQEICKKYELEKKSPVLYSPVQGKVSPRDLAAWILDEEAPVTMQIQMHKEIWGPKTRGV
jgi:7-carboxy-7-deazaguanine synthase